MRSRPITYSLADDHKEEKRADQTHPYLYPGTGKRKNGLSKLSEPVREEKNSRMR